MVKILVIDDDLPTCDLLKEFLSKKGYEVFISINGQEAVSIVEKEDPHIIMLDIVMPGRLGTETLRKIRKINTSAKIIMMTAVKDPQVITLCKKYGANKYITKPFSLEEIEKRLIPDLLKEII